MLSARVKVFNTFEYKLKIITRAAEISETGNRAAATEFEIDEDPLLEKGCHHHTTKTPYQPRKITSTRKNIERLGCEPEREQPCSYHRDDPFEGKRIGEANECY